MKRARVQLPLLLTLQYPMTKLLAGVSVPSVNMELVGSTTRRIQKPRDKKTKSNSCTNSEIAFLAPSFRC